MGKWWLTKTLQKREWVIIIARLSSKTRMSLWKENGIMNMMTREMRWSFYSTVTLGTSSVSQAYKMQYNQKVEERHISKRLCYLSTTSSRAARSTLWHHVVEVLLIYSGWGTLMKADQQVSHICLFLVSLKIVCTIYNHKNPSSMSSLKDFFIKVSYSKSFKTRSLLHGRGYFILWIWN